MAPVPEALVALFARSLASLSKDATVDSPSVAAPLPKRDNKKQILKSNFNAGHGSKPATDFNNQGFLALFALIGAGMVLAAIWFFFWAKNGGFVFKKTDWDDYKSTVLRRKGPDGKTLSNATRSTKLGMGSINGDQSYGYSEGTATTGYTDNGEMREVEAGMGLRGGGARHHSLRYDRKNRDSDVREYRHEKAARVGGLNRQHDGNHFDYSTTVPSDVSYAPLNPSGGLTEKEKKSAKKERERQEKEKKRLDKEAAKQEKEAAKREAKNKKAEEKSKSKDKNESKIMEREKQPGTSSGNRSRRSPPSASYSFINGDDNATEYSAPAYNDVASPQHIQSSPSHASDSYYSHYRPSATQQSPSQSPSHHSRTRSRQHNNTNSPSRTSNNNNGYPTYRAHHNTSRSSKRTDGIDTADWASQADSDTGTKIYPCHIPGLSSAGSVAASDSVSQAGARRHHQQHQRRSQTNAVAVPPPMSASRPSAGYRRGGGRRRDSLSDSEGEMHF